MEKALQPKEKKKDFFLKLRYFLFGMLVLAFVVTIIPPLLGVEIQTTAVLTAINVFVNLFRWRSEKKKE